MQRIRRIVSTLVALGLLGGVGALIYIAGKGFFDYLASIPKELGAALIAGATTILVATFTVMIGRYFERKRELDALYRDKKTEFYDEFLKVFFHVWFSAGKPADGKTEPDLVELFRSLSVKLVLWSGPNALEAFARWKELMAQGQLNAESIFETERFLTAIRADLRHSNVGLRRGWFARMFLQEGTLFLAMAAKNPNVTLAELAAAEKAFREARGKT
jgi:hypothetical protein